jgi:hypothetical protein
VPAAVVVELFGWAVDVLLAAAVVVGLEEDPLHPARLADKMPATIIVPRRTDMSGETATGRHRAGARA